MITSRIEEALGRKTVNDEMLKELRELYRRYAVAAIHDAGTADRIAEIRRASLPAKLLLSRSETLDKIGRTEILPGYGDIFLQTAKELKEYGQDPLKGLEILFRKSGQFAKTTHFVNEVKKLVEDANRVIDGLKDTGLYFQFSRFEVAILSPDQALMVINEVIGCLQGLVGMGEEKGGSS